MCVCVRVTTNGVVVRHQVLSPGWGSNTCQLKFGGSVQSVFIIAGKCSRGKYPLLCLPRSKPKDRPLLCYPGGCKPPLSTRETILSAKMSSGHYLMPSVDHSTGRAFPEATFWDVAAPLWWPFSQLLPPTPPRPLSPSLPPSSVQPYAFIKVQLTCLHHNGVWAILATLSIYKHCKSC